MYKNYPIDFVRLVPPFVRDTYEMRGTRRQGGDLELIWCHPKMRDFIHMDGMSKKNISQFVAMNIIVNDAWEKGYVDLAPIEDPEHPFFVLDVLDRSHYYSARAQVLPHDFSLTIDTKETEHETYHFGDHQSFT